MLLNERARPHAETPIESSAPIAKRRSNKVAWCFMVLPSCRESTVVWLDSRFRQRRCASSEPTGRRRRASGCSHSSEPHSGRLKRESYCCGKLPVGGAWAGGGVVDAGGLGAGAGAGCTGAGGTELGVVGAGAVGAGSEGAGSEGAGSEGDGSEG